MARRSRILAAKVREGSPAGGRAWLAPVATGAMALALIGLGQCSGRTSDLQARTHGGSVTVASRGAQSWSQFFACYPIPDGYLKVAVMQQYAQGSDPGRPPEQVRIPLEAEGGQTPQRRSPDGPAWLASLRANPATCPGLTG